MRWMDRFDARWLRRWTIALGIVGGVTLALPALAVVAFISIVGIPLGMAMVIAPTLFTVIALAGVVQRGLRRDGPTAVLVSVAVSLLLLAGLARFANSRLDGRADAFLAGDFDTLERPFRASAIGLASIGWQGWSKGETHCDELCQRLLLSGAAQRVLVAEWKTWEEPWTGQTPALVYRLEQRVSCPPIHLASRRSDRPIDDGKPEEAMRLSVAAGRCLIEEAGSLAAAEALVVSGRLHQGANEGRAGLSLVADTVTADRVGVYVREQEHFVERYRWTGVSILHHPLIPIPTLVGGHELTMYAGFLRTPKLRNQKDFSAGLSRARIDVVRFVRDELGLAVATPASVATCSRAELIARGLDNSSPVSPALQQLIEDFFESFAQRTAVDETTRLLAFRALADARVVAPRQTWSLARSCAKAGDAVNADLADILFARLMATDPALRENHPTYLGYPVSYLANAIAQLPPAAVLGHRRELDEVARDPARRRRALPALDQLTAFGAAAVPTLLLLVDAGGQLRKAATEESASSSDRSAREDWQGPYRSGLRGLCLLGRTGSAALEPLLTRLGEEGSPAGAGDDDPLLITLVRLGADTDLLRDRVVDKASPLAGHSFDRLVERAGSESACRY